jgi:hypothetical protein
MLLLVLVSSSSLDFVPCAPVGSGADGKADGKEDPEEDGNPVGKFGVCSCAYPTTDMKTQTKPTVTQDLALRPQTK